VSLTCLQRLRLEFTTVVRPVPVAIKLEPQAAADGTVPSAAGAGAAGAAAGAGSASESGSQPSAPSAVGSGGASGPVAMDLDADGSAVGAAAALPQKAPAESGFVGAGAGLRPMAVLGDSDVEQHDVF
jgi:hypothetical protein